MGGTPLNLGTVRSLRAFFWGTMGNPEKLATHPTKAGVSGCPGGHRSGGYSQLTAIRQKRLSRESENSSEFPGVALSTCPSSTSTAHVGLTLPPEPPPRPSACTHPAENSTDQLCLPLPHFCILGQLEAVHREVDPPPLSDWSGRLVP